MIAINSNIPFILFYEMEHEDLMDVVNLSNNLIMFNSQLKELESKYSLDLHNLSYKEVLETIETIDKKLCELIESEQSA